MRHVARNLTVVFRPDQGHTPPARSPRPRAPAAVLVLYAVACLSALVALGDVWVNSPVLAQLLAERWSSRPFFFLGGVYLGRRRRARARRVPVAPRVAPGAARAADAESR